MVRQLHAALTVPKHFPFNPLAEAFVPMEQQSIVKRQEEEFTKSKQTNVDTTAAGCWQRNSHKALCPTCKGTGTGTSGFLCWTCSGTGKVDPVDEIPDVCESSVPTTLVKVENQKVEDSDELQQTNADTTAACCFCESSVPTTPLSLAFCESCSPITKFCKDFHVRGPQARIAAYYSIQRSRFKAYPPWNKKSYRRNPDSDLEDECSTPSRRDSEDSEDYDLRTFLTSGKVEFCPTSCLR